MKGKIIDHTVSPPKQKDPGVGERYYLPAEDGSVYPCHVVGTAPAGILIKAGEDMLLLNRRSFMDFAVPFPKMDIVSILPDEDSNIIFVRYRSSDTWIDRVYNWYCKIVKKEK